jgi:hypothetical protein
MELFIITFSKTFAEGNYFLFALMCLVVVIGLTILIVKKGNERISETINILWDYFLNFGFFLLLGLFVLGSVFILFPNDFYWVLIVFVVASLIFMPTKFIFMLVGGRGSLSTLFILFIVTQFVFSGIYYKTLTSSTNVEQNSLEKKEIICYKQILLNTFHIALIQECSPYFQKYIDGTLTNSEINNVLHDKFFTILNIQIFISWIFLGVLIASLYRRIRNE